MLCMWVGWISGVYIRASLFIRNGSGLDLRIMSQSLRVGMEGLWKWSFMAAHVDITTGVFSLYIDRAPTNLISVPLGRVQYFPT